MQRADNARVPKVVQGSSGESRRVGSARLIWRCAAPLGAGFSPVEFRDPAATASLERHGYYLSDFFIGERAVEQLVDVYRENLIDAAPTDGAFYSTAWNGAGGADSAAYAATVQWLKPEIEKMVDRKRSRVLASVFQLKPAGPSSGLAPHQDSTLVDERRWSGAHAWVALTRSRAEDGALFVVPGSHRFARWPRVANADDEFVAYRNELMRSARVIEAEPGQVVLFDHATIHGSLPNRGGSTRVAASCVVIPAAADLLVPVPDPEDPAVARVLRYVPDALDRSPELLAEQGEPCGEIRPAKLGFSPPALRAACRLASVLRPGALGTKLRSAC